MTTAISVFLQGPSKVTLTKLDSYHAVRVANNSNEVITFGSPAELAGIALETLRQITLATGKRFVQCEGNDCDHVIPVQDATKLAYNAYVCNDCFDSQVHRCVTCNGYYLESEMSSSMEHGWMCDHCNDERAEPAYAERKYDEHREAAI